MVSIIISILSVLIAIIGLCFSIQKYRKHEKRLNEQQEEINEYILKEKRENENIRKMANLNIKADWEAKHKDATMLLTCTNNGYSMANNIRIELGDLEDRIKIVENSSYVQNYSLIPGGEIYILEFSPISLDNRPTWSIKVFWDDEYENNRQKVCSINIPN